MALSFSITAETVPLIIEESGTIRVGNTRVILELVIHSFNAGYSPEEIVMQYSALDLADVYSVIGYYLHHRAEIDQYVQQREEKAAEVRKKIEAQSNQTAIRQRLLDRKNGKQ